MAVKPFDLCPLVYAQRLARDFKGRTELPDFAYRSAVSKTRTEVLRQRTIACEDAHRMDVEELGSAVSLTKGIGSPPTTRRSEAIAVTLMWESLGPTHHDRLRALAAAGLKVHVIELSSSSATYQWERDAAAGYTVATLSDKPGGAGTIGLAKRLFNQARRAGARDLFFCHYERPGVFLASIGLRMLGYRVFTMMDSKFDDYSRALPRELLKALMLAPYRGALVASSRSRAYLRFLGIKCTAMGYDTIDIARMRAAVPADETLTPFAQRPFLVVARLVPKKNIRAILEAFARYRVVSGDSRELHIVGYGDLRESLEEQVCAAGLAGAVRFLGALESSEVARRMASALALILASYEEQFGLVVNEALAVGLPVIVSSNAGAVDVLVENLGNGVVIDPYRPETITNAMAHLASDEQRWTVMSAKALASAERGDACQFVSGLCSLANLVGKGNDSP